MAPSFPTTVNPDSASCWHVLFLFSVFCISWYLLYFGFTLPGIGILEFQFHDYNGALLLHIIPIILIGQLPAKPNNWILIIISGWSKARSGKKKKRKTLET